MENKKIIEIINNGGATLDGNYNNFNSDRGFMVSIQGQEVKVNKDNIKEIKKEIEKKREFIKDKKGLYVGLWLDSEIMYIDVSIHIINYLRALRVARNNEQLAIYDLKKNESIYLTYLKYYTLYRVVKDNDNNIIDYKMITQYDKKEDIRKELNASIKTIDNIIYKNFDHYEKRLKDYQNYILISGKITLEEIEA